MKKTFKGKKSIEILKVFGLIENIQLFLKMSQEFGLKNIDEKRNYFLEETKQTELVSRKHNYWIYFNFCFRFFDWYCLGITSYAITAEIKKYKSMIKKKKKRHDKIVLIIQIA